MQNVLEKVKTWYRGLPDKKRYIEFITALLTVPVLLTVLISNISNINSNKKTEEKVTPTIAVSPTEKIITITERIVEKEASATPTFTPTPTTPKECKKEVGPVRISSPAEGQLMNNNPVCISVNYQTGEYCSVVWSYRLDDGDWSEFTDKEICLYNMEVGPKSLELRVKSTQSDDEVSLIRNFYYKSKEAPTATPTMTPVPTSGL
jgi:hypothetical protein